MRLTGTSRTALALAVTAAVVVAVVTPLASPAAGETLANPSPVLVPGPPATAGCASLPPPDGSCPPTAAELYPSPIDVSGRAGTVTDVNVTLVGLTYRASNGSDFDVMLVAPDGSRVMLMSDACGDSVNADDIPIDSPVEVTFDDEAESALPVDAACSSGTFRLTDDDETPESSPFTGDDVFCGPPAASAPQLCQPPTAAEASPTSTDLSTFTGINPNGTWKLYVVDDTPSGPGQPLDGLHGGWRLDVTVSERAMATTTTAAAGTTATTAAAGTTATTAAAGGTTATTAPGPTGAGDDPRTTTAPGTAAAAPARVEDAVAPQTQGDPDRLAAAAVSHAATFSNADRILVPRPGAPPGCPSFPPPNNSCPPTSAQLYPSPVNVSGRAGTVTDVNVTLAGLTYRWWDGSDLDIMLVAPNGSRVMLMSDACGDSVNADAIPIASPVDLTFDDEARSPLPLDAACSSGTYRPTDEDEAKESFPFTGDDVFCGPPAAAAPQLCQPPTAAEASATSTDLNTFTGINPNGTWKLYVVDDTPSDPGTDLDGLTRGWRLEIATSEQARGVVNTTSPQSGTDPAMAGGDAQASANPQTAGGAGAAASPSARAQGARASQGTRGSAGTGAGGTRTATTGFPVTPLASAALLLLAAGTVLVTGSRRTSPSP